ncbi:MAG: hypothetical protein ACT7A5_23050 [Ferrovibrionaceae bacterium]
MRFSDPRLRPDLVPAARGGEASSWPTRLAELAPAERLVISAFRYWVGGPADRQAVLPLHAHQAGAAAAPALAQAFAGYVELLRDGAARTITYHQPGCDCLGPDEMLVMLIVMAEQAELPDLARLLASWLVRPVVVPGLIQAARAYGDALARAGVALPWRPLRPGRLLH